MREGKEKNGGETDHRRAERARENEMRTFLNDYSFSIGDDDIITIVLPRRASVFCIAKERNFYQPSAFGVPFKFSFSCLKLPLSYSSNSSPVCTLSNDIGFLATYNSKSFTVVPVFLSTPNSSRLDF